MPDSEFFDRSNLRLFAGTTCRRALDPLDGIGRALSAELAVDREEADHDHDELSHRPEPLGSRPKDR